MSKKPEAAPKAIDPKVLWKQLGAGKSPSAEQVVTEASKNKIELKK